MPRMTKSAAMLASLLGLLALHISAAGAVDRPFAVIAAPGSIEHRLSPGTVAQIFKRKKNYWDNGARIHPVNLPASHPLRRAFSQSVLGHPPEAMEEYWKEQYFHGVLPPHVFDSEEALALFVSVTPGAIGYVSACLPEHKYEVVLTVGDLPSCAK
jgi:ABC-type phosphate transport system substrate-binding protein